MLEESIAELTKAVLALTYALNQSRMDVGAAEPGERLVFVDKVELPVLHATVEVPNEKPKTSSASTTAGSESESAAVSYDDVKKATNALSAAKGRDATIAVLSRFDVKKATELDEAQWVDYIEHAGKVTEGADV